MKLDFYYWSYQCPLNHDMLQLLDQYKGIFDIHIYDVLKQPDLAKKMQMYYPTLLVVDGTCRFYGVLRESFLKQLSIGIIPEEKPYRISLGTEVVTAYLKRLDDDNLSTAVQCTGGCHITSCALKGKFYQTYSQAFYGYIMVDQEDRLLGGVEYVSSHNVPYDIPKSEHSAFITCVYTSHTTYDYKSIPLKALEDELSGVYIDIYVISDEMGTFPNGDLAFFLSHGYEDKGILQDNAYCRLHLLYKKL